MAALLEPKEIKITGQDGKERTYIISKFPAVLGREIVSKYPLSAIPKLGDYEVNQETMLKLMAHVAVPMKTGEPLRLSTQVLVDNHVADWEILAKLEYETMQYNCSFFLKDKALTFLDVFSQMVTLKISEILTTSLPSSSQKIKQP